MILATQDNIEKYTKAGIWSKKNLLSYFKDHVKEDPNRVCIVDPIDKKKLVGLQPERLTYKEFAKAADATAEALLDIGLGRDDIIIVQMPNCWELAMLYLSISSIGAIISPVPILWRDAELKYVVNLTQAKAFITIDEFHGFKHKELAKKLQSLYSSLKKILTLQDIRNMSKGDVTGKLDNIKVDANDIFTICWTSGTETEPKGCPLSHNNWTAMSPIQESMDIRPNDTLLTAGPLVNMASVGTIFIPWILLGGKIVLHHPFNPVLLMNQIIQEKVNYTLLVPAILNIILKHPKIDTFDFSSVRSISVGSAPPSLWVMKEFKRRWGIDIGNAWGMNEGAGIFSGIQDVPDMEKRIDHFPHYGKTGSKWESRANSCIEIKIVDPEGKELGKAGDVGELLYKGPSVMSCYFRNMEMTRRAFTGDGFFRTGDLFEIREDDFISYYERSKDIIIRGGFNVSSQEIENYLLSHPKILDVAIVSMPDKRVGEKICAYVVPQKGKSVTLKDLRSLLAKKNVARYKYPEKMETIDIIPRNPVGKILKNKLREDIREKLKEQEAND